MEEKETAVKFLFEVDNGNYKSGERLDLAIMKPKSGFSCSTNSVYLMSIILPVHSNSTSVNVFNESVYPGLLKFEM